MSSSQQPLGLYIHVPFCAGKCPYCDFYSRPYRKADWLSGETGWATLWWGLCTLGEARPASLAPSGWLRCWSLPPGILK